MEPIPAQVNSQAFNGVDPDTFQRVWNRVMPDQSLSPIEMDTITPGPMPPVQTEPEQPGQPEQPEQPSQPVQPDQPVQPEQPDQPSQPSQPEQPPAEQAQLLPRLMDQLYAAWQRSQCLARQTAGSVNRLFASAAEEQRRGLKRLSAAYFLQSGQWYTPSRSASARMGQGRVVGMSNLLRDRYLWERQWEQTCRAAAQSAQDDALRSLLTCLAQEAAGRACQLRAALEQNVRLS